MDKKSTATTKETKRTRSNSEGTSKTRSRTGGAAKTGSSQSHSGQQHHRHSADTAVLEREERKGNRSSNAPEDDDNYDENEDR
jgi:hypothetical protein